ncbi:MAG: hypothetical protein EZS28_031711, partial [Streblomastix strix]
MQLRSGDMNKGKLRDEDGEGEETDQQRKDANKDERCDILIDSRPFEEIVIVGTRNYERLCNYYQQMHDADVETNNGQISFFLSNSGNLNDITSIELPLSIFDFSEEFITPLFFANYKFQKIMKIILNEQEDQTRQNDYNNLQVQVGDRKVPYFSSPFSPSGDTRSQLVGNISPLKKGESKSKLMLDIQKKQQLEFIQRQKELQEQKEMSPQNLALLVFSERGLEQLRHVSEAETADRILLENAVLFNQQPLDLYLQFLRLKMADLDVKNNDLIQSEVAEEQSDLLRRRIARKEKMKVEKASKLKEQQERDGMYAGPDRTFITSVTGEQKKKLENEHKKQLQLQVGNNNVEFGSFRKKDPLTKIRQHNLKLMGMSLAEADAAAEIRLAKERKILSAKMQEIQLFKLRLWKLNALLEIQSLFINVTQRKAKTRAFVLQQWKEREDEMWTKHEATFLIDLKTSLDDDQENKSNENIKDGDNNKDTNQQSPTKILIQPTRKSNLRQLVLERKSVRKRKLRAQRRAKARERLQQRKLAKEQKRSKDLDNALAESMKIDAKILNVDQQNKGEGQKDEEQHGNEKLGQQKDSNKISVGINQDNDNDEDEDDEDEDEVDDEEDQDESNVIESSDLEDLDVDNYRTELEEAIRLEEEEDRAMKNGLDFSDLEGSPEKKRTKYVEVEKYNVHASVSDFSSLWGAQGVMAREKEKIKQKERQDREMLERQKESWRITLAIKTPFMLLVEDGNAVSNFDEDQKLNMNIKKGQIPFTQSSRSTDSTNSQIKNPFSTDQYYQHTFFDYNDQYSQQG